MSYKEALKQEPEAMEESVSETDVAPDGGYGWVILGSGFMCIFVLDGLNGTFGLLYPELLHYFNASPSFTSMVGSTMIGTFLLVGVFTSFLINKFGCRLVAFVGACISSVGFLLCFAATDIWFLFFTYGIVTGVLNTLGRLFSGALANTRVISPLALCNIGMFACAVTCFLFPLCTSVGTLTAFAVALGFFLGVFPPLQPLMVVECVGLENLTNAFGIMTMCKGPAAIAGPPLAGAVYEYTKNYSSSVGFAGLLFLLTTIVQCMVPLCGKRDSRFLCLSSCVHSESNTCSNKKYVKSDVDGNESSTTDSSMT